jgi:uracil-DNA glycosylase family 4
MYNEGSLNSNICFIGEAPGAQEERTGKPFVGPAGELFSELLISAGILRSRCYITNVVKERPPNNNISLFISLRGDNDARMTAEYLKHEQSLYDELSQCNANVFVPLGNVALFALTRLTKITKRRGSILEIHSGAGSVLAGRKVIPTIHPSACLHTTTGGGMYLYRHYIAHDLLRIKEQAEFKEVKLLNRDIIVEPSFEKAMEFLIHTKNNCKIIGVDIEVYNNEVSCISFAPTNTYAISIPFVRNRYDYYSLDEESRIWEAIRDILEDTNIIKVGQNIVFDASFLFNRYRIVVEPVEDTMIAQAIITPDFPKGLDFITSIYTDIPYYKDEGKKWKEGGDRAFWIYNAKDSIAVMDAYPKMMVDIATIGNEDVYNRQKGIIPILVFMSERGIKIDLDSMKQAAIDAKNEVGKLQEELNTICGMEVNPNSPKQMQKLFYITLGYQPYLKDGRMTVDDTALKRLKRKGCKQADLVSKIRHITKLLGNYLDTSKVDADGRYRCSFNPVGTVNGRLSSSETIFGSGGNMQNWPSEMRRFMIADEGYIIYEVDLEQAENRIVAYTSPEPAMIMAFERGIDVHALTASMLSGIDINEVIRQDKEGIPCELGDGSKTWRFWGKRANHGLDYGEGYKKFSLLNELPESEGKRIVEAFHSMYPGIRLGQRWIVDKLRESRSLVNCYGRRRIFMERWGDDLFKQAYNYNPQSTVADKINEDGLLYIWNNPELYYVEILNQVHDSIVFQIPLSQSLEYHVACLSLIKQSLEKPITWRNNTVFSIPAAFKVGKNMYDMKPVKPNLDSLREAIAWIG